MGIERPALLSLMVLELGSSDPGVERAPSVLLPVSVQVAEAEPAELGPAPRPRPAQLEVPAGEYRPFYRTDPRQPATFVPSFAIDASTVSRAEYLEFVERVPRWRRSRIDGLFAERAYLSDWQADLAPGSDSAGPVVFVSWFAAKAYCAWRRQRLPSVVEWERALGNSAGQRGAWEWVLDFNGVASSDSEQALGAGSSFCGAGALASDARDYGAFLRYAFRSSLRGDFALKNLGFRCAGVARP